MKKNRNKKLIAVAVIILILLVCLTGFMVLKNLYSYALISFTLVLIDIILLVIYLNNTKSNKDKFKSDLRYITRTFDSVLAYMDNNIRLKGKSVVKLNSFEDLVNCQEEFKKPILYNYNDNSAVFMIFFNKEVYYTTLKEDDTYIHPFEEELIKKMNSNIEEPDDTILEDVDKTMIIQTKSNKRFKVSPIRKNKDDDKNKNS